MKARQIQRATALYKRGRTLREIATELDTDSKEVWRAIRDRVEIRRRGPRGRRDVPDELIVDLRDSDMSWPEISREVNMSRSGVRARYLIATTGQRWR